MTYFRMKIGYGKNDFISIDETELSKAMRCMIKGSVGIFKEGMISGRSIISILPDWQQIMGYKRDYELQSEDYQEIGEKRQKEYRDLLMETQQQIENGNELKRLS